MLSETTSYFPMLDAIWKKNKANESLWKEYFRMSRESFYKLCQKLNPYLVKRFMDESLYISWLSVRFFFILYKQFRQCIGPIDSIHIEIKEPKEDYSDFINPKGYTSINIQAVCGYKDCVMDVFVKWSGSVCDGGIFQNQHRLLTHRQNN